MDNAEVLNEYEKYVHTDTPATGGNVAYDLSRFDSRESVQEAVQDAAEERRPAPRQEAAPRARLSLGTLLMYLLIAGMAALLISSYMRLTIMTDELSGLSRELDDLKNEEVILQKQYEERYTLSEIETYAVEQLGMVKLEGNMTEYIELSNPDTITIIDPYEEDQVSGLFNRLGDKLRDLLSFLA